MTKQKALSRKKTTTIHRHKPPMPPLTHTRRAWWFAVLTSGLIVIQLAYNVHNGQPQVLGYTTNISTQTLLNDTNSYRVRANLPTLHLNQALNTAAQAKAQRMILQNYWSHIAPDGTTPWQYLQQVGYSYAQAGENLAYGFSTSNQIVAAWMNSPEHRDNVLGDYTDVGFGFANGSHYQNGDNTVVVAFYGLPGNQPVGTVTPGQPSPPDTSSTAAAAVASSAHVNGMTTIVSGNAPWATYASLSLVGATFMGFLVTHLETLRLGWRNARRYAILHPTIDVCVLLGIALVVVQAAGGFIK